MPTLQSPLREDDTNKAVINFSSVLCSYINLCQIWFIHPCLCTLGWIGTYVGDEIIF
jgi:hypothetical protein